MALVYSYRYFMGAHPFLAGLFESQATGRWNGLAQILCISTACFTMASPF